MPEYMVAGNWKMNTTLREAVDLVTAMRPGLEAVDGVTSVVCPPFVSLSAVSEILLGSSVRLGAQNMHKEPKGAFTGEVSAAMLAGLCEFVILGHSERRQLFAETDTSVNLKVRAANEAGLRPIVCVGEGLEQREKGDANAVVEGQIRAGLAYIDSIDGLIVAYEPIWAIGTGVAATPEAAQDVMGHIRAVLADLHDGASSESVPLLYGGSVTPDNAATFFAEKDVNGALVGGASLQSDSFVAIAGQAAAARG